VVKLEPVGKSMKKACIYLALEPAQSSIQSHSQWHRRCVAPFALKTTILVILISFYTAQAQYRSTQWTADSGLPQNVVRGIVQAPDGYLWIATLNGVARFDGVRFVVFDKSNSPGITTNRFAAMVQGAHGDLWLYSEDGAVTQYHNNEFRTLGASDGAPLGSVHGITSDRQGHVWIIRDQNIFEWNERSGHFEPMTNNDEIHYRGLNWDGTGFWGARGQQLYCFRRGNLSVHTVPEEIQLANIRKVAAGSDGAIWISLPHDQIARFFENKWQLSSKPFQTSFQSRTRKSWSVTIDTHLDRTLSYPSGGLEKDIRYNTIIDDNERNLWVGSEGQGLYRIQPQTIHVYSVAQGLAGANVYPVFSDAHGDMWVGTWPAGLTQFHEGRLKTYTTKDGLPGLVSALAEDSGGDLWVGTHSGLAVLTQGRLHIPNDLPPDMPVVQAILPVHDGSLLFGTPRGVYKYKPVGKDHGGSWLEIQPGTSVGDVRVIVEGKNGDLWFGGYSGLTRLHNGAVTHWTERDGLPSNNVRSIYEDAQGVLWIGTYDGGLGRYSDGHWTHYSQKNGLFDNGVFQILEDSQANLWMSSNRGIFRVSKKELNDIARGVRESVITVSYGRNDGMLNAECNGGLWPAGAKDKAGRLWFPTQEGVAVVEPESVTRDQKSPSVVIESADVDHVRADATKSITITPGQKNLEIQYTALSFSRPEQIVFRYMMEGLDAGWQEVGYRRTAYFSHLPPGNYVFRVMAANSDGVWSTTENSLPINVLPPFYRTTWFVAAMAVLAFILTYALWSFRVRQFKRIQAAQKAFSQQLISSQEAERRRISGELHDSLGQRLIIIKNHALFLLRPMASKQSEEERRETIEEINTEASSAIEETRTISYNLRPFQLDRLGLSKAIEALVRSASRATGIHFSTSIADIDQVFPEELRINFYRIVQEGLNNIMKHSGASEGEIRVEKTHTGVLLSIRDNGAGFSLDRNVAGGKGGFGLLGMRERAASLDGTVKIQSNPGIGTLLTVDFDLKKYSEN
jgi:signal transduction histidine kinase/streptogramin lyase